MILFMSGVAAVGQEFDSLQNIRIQITFTSPPTSWSVSKSPLRFNKRFAYSFQMDDGANDIWTHGYPFFQGGTIDGTAYPGLKYTDGCGNDYNFKMSSALYSFNSTGSNAQDVHDPNSAYATVNVTWPQLVTMCSNNWGIANHGLSPGNAGNYDYEIKRNHSYVKLKTLGATNGGLDMGAFVNPNGDQGYTIPAFNLGYLVCYRDGYSFGQPSFNVNGVWPHQNIMMGRTNTWNSVNLSALVDAIANASAGEENHWGVHFTHAINNATWGYDFNTFKTHLNYIAGKYGKSGLDNIWMATEEEVLDYLLVRDAIFLQTQLTGNTLVVTFSGSLPDIYRFYSSTLLIRADVPVSAITLQGVSGYSFTGIGNDSAMVNISWNGKQIIPPEETAEYWVSRAEQTHSQDDANIAMDYVLMVPEGPVQQAFRVRLCSISGVTMPYNFCTMRNAPVTTIPATGGCPAGSVNIPLLVNGFSGITSASLWIEYNPQVMTFVSGSAAHPSITPGMQFTDEPVGGSSSLRKTVITWSSTTQKTLAQQDTLAILTCQYQSGSSAVSFNPGEASVTFCDYKDENGRPMYDLPDSAFYLNGEIHDATLPAPGVITGPATVCAGSQNLMFRVGQVAGAESYEWVLPPGYIAVSGAQQDTIIISLTGSAASGELRVRAVNTCNNNPLSPSFLLTVIPAPVPTITGIDSICEGTSGVTYNTEPSMAGYQWSVSPEGTIVSGQGTPFLTVNWNTAGNGLVGVGYTGTEGCPVVDPTHKPVTIHALPDPVVDGPVDCCIGQVNSYSTTGGMSGYIWTVSPGGIIQSGTGTSAIQVQWIDTGYQSVLVKYTDTKGCTNIIPSGINVHVYPLPVPIISGNYALCNGRTGIVYSTQQGMTNYAWGVSSGGTITGGTGTSSVTINWNQAGTGNVSVNYADVHGCSALSPASYPVTVYPLPEPVISGPSALCKNSSGIVYTTEPGMTDYNWLISSGGILTSGWNTSAVTVHWDSAGAQWISVNYKNSNGCTAIMPVSLPVEVFDLPVPSISGEDTLCAGTLAVYATQPGMSSYQWEVSPGGSIVNGTGSSQIQVLWNSSGNQFIKVSCQNAQGCSPSSPAWLHVYLKPLPVPSLAGASVACDQSAGVIYSTELGMTGYSWTVSGGGIITSGQGTPVVSVTWNGAGSQWIAITYTHINGCNPQAPTSLPVWVRPLPEPVILGPGALCQGSTGTIYSTQAGNANYVWSVTSGGIITSGSGTHMVTVDWIAAGQQVLSVSYTDPFGCAAPSPFQKNIQVNPLPAPSISGNDSLCSGESAQYFTEPGMTGYLWSVTPGGVITGGAGTGNVTVQWTTAGFHTISVNYTNPEGCVAPGPTYLNVMVFQQPVPVISGSTGICEGATGVTYMTESGMVGYNWSVTPGGTITSGQGTAVVSVDWTAAGIQVISVTYTTPAGCSSQVPASLQVTVNPIPVPSVNGQTAFCINAGPQGYSTQPGQVGYLWQVSPGGQILTGQGTANLQVNWVNAGPQWVSCIYSTSAGCQAMQPDTLFLDIAPVPEQPGTISGANIVCAPESWLPYEIEPVAFALNYVWTIPPGAVIAGSANGPLIHVNFLPGAQSGNITVHGTNACGSGPSSSLSVSVFPTPGAPVVTHPEPALLQSSLMEGNQWYLNDQVIPGANDPVLIAGESGLYHATVTINGCASVASNKVYVVITSTGENDKHSAVIIPNPSTGKFIVQMKDAGSERFCLRITDIHGKEIYALDEIASQGNMELMVNLPDVRPGLYMLVLSKGESRWVGKLLINK